MRIDTIADHSSRTDDSLMAESLHTEIESALAILPQNEQNILKMSFGIDHPHPCSLDEIALQMKLTRERVRQIQAKAITRLKRSSNTNKLKMYL